MYSGAFIVRSRPDLSRALYLAVMVMSVVRLAGPHASLADDDPPPTLTEAYRTLALSPDAGPTTLRFRYVVEGVEAGDRMGLTAIADVATDLTQELADEPQVTFKIGGLGQVSEERVVWLNDPGQYVVDAYAETYSQELETIFDDAADKVVGDVLVVVEAAGDQPVPVRISASMYVDWEDGHSQKRQEGCVIKYGHESPISMEFIDEVPGDLLAER